MTFAQMHQVNFREPRFVERRDERKSAFYGQMIKFDALIKSAREISDQKSVLQDFFRMISLDDEFSEPAEGEVGDTGVSEVDDLVEPVGEKKSNGFSGVMRDGERFDFDRVADVELVAVTNDEKSVVMKVESQSGTASHETIDAAREKVANRFTVIAVFVSEKNGVGQPEIEIGLKKTKSAPAIEKNDEVA